jgi:hypothetical protein
MHPLLLKFNPQHTAMSAPDPLAALQVSILQQQLEEERQLSRSLRLFVNEHFFYLTNPSPVGNLASKRQK